MAEPGDITALGLLYEGSDFAEWDMRITRLLRCNGYPMLPDLDCFDWIFFDCDDIVKLYTIFRAQLSESLRKRIPYVESPEGKDVNNLINPLERIAKTFRFLDLPAEMRNTIYEMALPKAGLKVIQENKNGDSSLDWIRTLPLLQVSSQVRKEASSIFYATTTFEFELGISNDTAAAMKTFSHWASEIVKDNIKHIRHIYIQHRLSGLNLYYFKGKGLGIAAEVGLDLATLRPEKTEHLQSIAKACRVAGVRDDQALVVALSSSEVLWKTDLRRRGEE